MEVQDGPSPGLSLVERQNVLKPTVSPQKDVKNKNKINIIPNTAWPMELYCLKSIETPLKQTDTVSEVFVIFQLDQEAKLP
jgi:hypothetical protein